MSVFFQRIKTSCMFLQCFKTIIIIVRNFSARCLQSLFTKKDIDEIVEYMIIQIFCQQTIKLQFSLEILHNLYHSYGYYYQLFQYVTESKGHYGNTYSKKLHYVVYKYKYYSIPYLVKEWSQLWKLFEGYDLPWCTKQPAEQSFNNKCSIIIL